MLLETAKSLFGTNDFYEILGAQKGATQDDLKKKYYKIALKTHPDRAPEDKKELATKKFQVISCIWTVLSDPEKRALYDETGGVDDGSSLDSDRNWEDYWRELFPKVTKKDIDAFTTMYKGSKDELKDLKTAFTEGEGDIDYIFDHVICSNVLDDESRFRQLLDDLIQSGEVSDFPKFHERDAKKKSRQQRAKKEAKEAEQMMAEMGGPMDDDSLALMIQNRQKQRGGLLSALEAKYCSNDTTEKKKPRRAQHVEPSDEEFLQARGRIEKKKRK
eukprot:c5014_g1_i1.p1 GENE.c5014_g1_i1~~c5014_g1_i1.p1  ORF type:complete len:289 (+),score=76.11 c5014_g1_i1:47-868(+)